MIATLTKRLFAKLCRKAYRDSYVAEHVRTGIAYQVRAMREARGWAQKKLAEILGKPQSVVSRLEDPDYGKLSVQSLLEIASAFDVALLVQFVSYPEFLRRTRDVSASVLNAESFNVDQLQPIASGSTVIYRPSQTTGVVIGRFVSGGSVPIATPAHTQSIRVH